MADPRHARGQAAEEAAASWLADHGWQILARRYRVPAGEVDIVALDPRRVLVGVEVRQRGSARSGPAEASVSGRHLRRVSAALVAYARSHPVPHHDLRLDLVAVQPGPAPRTWHLRRIREVGGW